MATFEDNNPFASPSSPSSSRANSYAPFGSYAFSPSGQTHNPHPSLDSSNRPTTSSDEDAPAYQFRTTNSDFSVEPPPDPAAGTSEGPASTLSQEKDGESCCKIDEILLKNPEMRIVITNASKASDGGANFIAYTIDVGVSVLFNGGVDGRE
jgi:hypothetical protein